MNKFGYSKVEILIVIVLLGIVAFIAINKTSYAFAVNEKDAVNEVKYLIEVQAKDYAMANTTLFDETSTTYISVDDLVEAGYLMGDANGIVTDPTDENKNFNDKKVKLEYDEENNDVSATVID